MSSLEQRKIQEGLGLPLLQLEPDYVVNHDGSTDRFFSEGYLLDVLRGWRIEVLEHVPILNRLTGEPFKYVWRVIARR